MKRLILLHGDPGQGKSHLARKLQGEYSFEWLSLDKLYVERIKKHCPFLYFPDLSKFVSHHYQYFLRDARTYILSKYQRDLLNEWHLHLYATVQAMSEAFDDLVVEGWLLHDCLGEVQAQMSGKAQVFAITVVDRKYIYSGKELTVQDILALGTTSQGTT